MSRFRPRQLHARALIADVLPFEVPLIFTNDFFFASTLPLKCDANTVNILNAIRQRDNFTIPLNYKVVKERGKNLTLSIIHPIAQIRMARLIDNYAETIINYCERSEFSLRRPFEIVSAFAGTSVEYGATVRDGLPHELLVDGSPDYSRMASFFRLKKYNLLAKFHDSKEFIDLEKRFSRMLTIDVSKCFFNIYTHSLGWAIKGKSETKATIQSFSFESDFDQVMQFANYKETNGIVVGPEISRIFAELIFQSIDMQIQSAMKSVHGMEIGRYDIRRYVDDFHIFANSEEDLEKIEEQVVSLLNDFKLYANSAKRIITSRPFVSPITKMKHDVGQIIDDVSRIFRSLAANGTAVCDKSLAYEVASKLKSCRVVLQSGSVGFHNVSGWLMWKYRSMLRDALTALDRAENDDERDNVSRMIASILDAVFYVVSLDFRVRTGFNLAILINELRRRTKHSAYEQAEWLNNFAYEETLKLVDISVDRSSVDSIESINILLLGAHTFKERFVKSSSVRRALNILAQKKLNYFKYICLKFCYLKDQGYFQSLLDSLNNRASEHVLNHKDKLKLDSELHLLFCDIISSPDLEVDYKKRFLNQVLAKELVSRRVVPATDTNVRQLSALVGFVDWTGARLHHTLARRRLRSSREY